MKTILRGKAWCFGSNISTDEILPGRFLDRANNEVGAYAMAGIDEHFSERITPGDFIVAGTNFGCGSSRETAAIAIKNAGIAAVVAESFARIFFRNAINIGLPAIIIASTANIGQGDELEINLRSRQVRNLSTGQSYPILNLSGISLDILRHGGIIEYTLARMKQG